MNFRIVDNLELGEIVVIFFIWMHWLNSSAMETVSKADLNSVFSFTESGCHTKAKDPGCPTIYSWLWVGTTDRFMHYWKVKHKLLCPGFALGPLISFSMLIYSYTKHAFLYVDISEYVCAIEYVCISVCIWLIVCIHVRACVCEFTYVHIRDFVCSYKWMHVYWCMDRKVYFSLQMALNNYTIYMCV